MRIDDNITRDVSKDWMFSRWWVWTYLLKQSRGLGSVEVWWLLIEIHMVGMAKAESDLLRTSPLSEATKSSNQLHQLHDVINSEVSGSLRKSPKISVHGGAPTGAGKRERESKKVSQLIAWSCLGTHFVCSGILRAALRLKLAKLFWP